MFGLPSVRLHFLILLLGSKMVKNESILYSETLETLFTHIQYSISNKVQIEGMVSVISASQPPLPPPSPPPHTLLPLTSSCPENGLLKFRQK